MRINRKKVINKFNKLLIDNDGHKYYNSISNYDLIKNGKLYFCDIDSQFLDNTNYYRIEEHSTYQILEMHDKLKKQIKSKKV